MERTRKNSSDRTADEMLQQLMDWIPEEKPKYCVEEMTKTTPAQWRAEIQDNVKWMRKARRKFGADYLFDITDPLIRRRTEALEHTLAEVQERYGDYEGYGKNGLNEVVRTWIRLNLGVESTYNQLENRDHLFHAAAIWILDAIRQGGAAAEVRRFLASGESQVTAAQLADVPELQARDITWSEDEIASVVSILYNRYADSENILPDSSGIRHVVTGEALARHRHTAAGPHRKAFDTLMKMIPEDQIEKARESYRQAFWEWTDGYFRTIGESRKTLEKIMGQTDQAAERFNQTRQDLLAAIRGDAPQEMPMRLPGLTLPLNGDLQETMRVLNRNSRDPLALGGIRPPYSSFSGLTERLVRDHEAWCGFVQAMQECGNLLTDLHWCLVSMDDSSEDTPVSVRSPYGICFALLLLLDEDDDLPWLMGPGLGMLAQVAGLLPWNGDAGEDGIPADLDTDVSMPDLYTTRLEGPNGEKRNLAQIFCQETGWILPREEEDLHQGALTDGGHPMEHAGMLLPLFTVLDALTNRENDAMEETPETAEEKRGENAADIDALRGEIRRLHAAEHAARRRAEDLQTRLEEMQAETERTRRELADLRARVFNQENPETEEERESQEDEAGFPYEVQHVTVVFGGHDTWRKAIVPRLRGNIRFIDRDVNFDPVIIRRAEAVWVQPNALSHAQYYRIIDTARQYRRPVRYFAHASALKSAVQLREADEA